MSRALFVLMAAVACFLCSPSHATSIPSRPNSAAAPYVASFSAAGSLTVTAATHKLGTNPIPLGCWDNATPRVPIAMAAGFPTVAANGDVVFDWSGTPSGTCAIVSASASSTAGGDLAGSYPNPTVASGAITLAKIAAGAKAGATGTKLATVEGTLTPGNCLESDADGDLVDAGDPCGTGAGAGSSAWDDLTGGTSTGDSFLIGNGSSLGPTGTGTITATDLACTDCIGAVEIAAIALGTDTTGQYVAEVTANQGLALSGATAAKTVGLQDCGANESLRRNSLDTAWICVGSTGGDVSGPSSATDNAIARFDTTTGKVLQNSGITIADGASGTLSGTNTGDQTITLSGAVTGTGTGPIVTSLSNGAVVLGTHTTGNYAGSSSPGGAATSALTATTAGALAANGSNCSAGQWAAGVSAAGAAEGCTADDDVPDANEVIEAALDVENAPTDEYALTWEATSGRFAWQLPMYVGDFSTAVKVRDSELAAVPAPNDGEAPCAAGEIAAYTSTGLTTCYAPLTNLASLDGLNDPSILPWPEYGVSYNGNPNGNVACATADRWRKMVYDTSTSPASIWRCTTTGNAASAVWTSEGGSGSPTLGAVIAGDTANPGTEPADGSALKIGPNANPLKIEYDTTGDVLRYVNPGDNAAKYHEFNAPVSAVGYLSVAGDGSNYSLYLTDSNFPTAPGLTSLVSCSDANSCGVGLSGWVAAAQRKMIEQSAAGTTVGDAGLALPITLASGSTGDSAVSAPNDSIGPNEINNLGTLSAWSFGANAIGFGTTGIIAEGATNDGIETLLTFQDPTSSDNTVTVPNETGTIVTTGGTNRITNALMADDAIGSAEIAAAAVAASELADQFQTSECAFNAKDLQTGDTGILQCHLPEVSTLVRVYCNTTASDATVNLIERTEAAPNTGTTEMLSADLVCDSDGASTTSFADSSIAADALLTLKVDAETLGSSDWVRIFIEYRVD